MIFKRSDYFIISIIFFFFGLFVMSQYKAGKTYVKSVAPENNATLAIEVAKLTKSNADLRLQVKKVTSDLDLYQNTTESKKLLYENYKKELGELNIINSLSPVTGRGVIIKIEGRLSTPQIIDLVNAIKNIGSDLMTVNGKRVALSSDLSQFADQDNYNIAIHGNGKLLKSALERRGGIIELISSRDLKISVEESDNIVIPSGESLSIKFSKSINN